MIKVKFYGTRGSISVCGPKFQEFGGNTTCIQITDMKTNRIGIFDAGTGIRDLGNDLVASGHEQANACSVRASSTFIWFLILPPEKTFHWKLGPIPKEVPFVAKSVAFSENVPFKAKLG